MLIDWFTVVAQVINFLILVWLLKKFLYKPILNTIDERENKVKAILQDADAKKQAASSEREEYLHKKQELEQQRTDYLSKAARDAEAEREKLFDRARHEYEDKRNQYARGLEQEEAHLAQALSSSTRKEVFAIARKALRDLADARLEASITNHLVRRLKAADSSDKERLAADFGVAPGDVLVRTADEMSPEQQNAIRDALTSVLGMQTQCHFETNPDLIGGLEITLGGKKLAWSIKEYLSALENDVHDILKHQSESRAQPRPSYDMNARQNVGLQGDQA